MKRTFLTFMLLIMVFTIKSFSQSLTELERNPSFKGITIGAPIGKYSDILTFSHTSQAGNVYHVSQESYLSIFHIKMQNMLVVERHGKVYSIFLEKYYPANNSGAMEFNPNELLVLFSELKTKYGDKFFDLDDTNRTPSVCGMRWKANSVALEIVYLFYGTFVDKRPRLSYNLYQLEDDY